MGADDFIRKPFSQRLLVGRSRSSCPRLTRDAAAKDATTKEADSKVLERGCCAWTTSSILHLEERAGDVHRHRVSHPESAGD
jgi:DNA-binding response OmpR family regulator